MTPRQMQVLRFMARFQSDNGYAPSMRAIAAGIGGSSHVNAYRLVNALSRQGFVRRTGSRMRRRYEVMQVPVIGACPCCGQLSAPGPRVSAPSPREVAA